MLLIFVSSYDKDGLMDSNENLILVPAKWSDYQRFKPLCCVGSVPAIAGPCWTVLVEDSAVAGFSANDVAFIGYSFAFRRNSIRMAAIPELRLWGRRGQMAFLNRYVRCLTRVMVRPAFRGRGIASWVVGKTLELVGVPYVECLTFTAGIASILSRCDFVNYGRTGGMGCDYFLWSRAAASAEL